MCGTLSLLSLVNSWGDLPSKALGLIWSSLNKPGVEEMPNTWVSIFSLSTIFWIGEVVLSSQNPSNPDPLMEFPWKFASVRCGRDKSALCTFPDRRLWENPGSSLSPLRSVSHQHMWHRSKITMEFYWSISCQQNPLPVDNPHFFSPIAVIFGVNIG